MLLDDLSLTTTSGDSMGDIKSDLRQVKYIGILNRRRIINYPITNIHGSFSVDNGRYAIRVLVKGSFLGEKSLDNISSLRLKYKESKPVSLVTEIGLISGIEKVIIEKLQIISTSEIQQSYSYEMILREYKDPENKNKSTSPPSLANNSNTEFNNQVSNLTNAQ